MINVQQNKMSDIRINNPVRINPKSEVDDEELQKLVEENNRNHAPLRGSFGNLSLSCIICNSVDYISQNFLNVLWNLLLQHCLNLLDYYMFIFYLFFVSLGSGS
jgi:hypothetical protein